MSHLLFDEDDFNRLEENANRKKVVGRKTFVIESL